MSASTASRGTRLGLSVVGAALLLGVLTDLLLRSTPWGLNLTVCTLTLLALCVWISRRHQVRVSADAGWLAGTAALCAVAFVRRDSSTLRTLDILMLAGVLALTALAIQGGMVRRRGITAYLLALPSAVIESRGGLHALLLGDIRWSECTAQGRGRRWAALGTGVLIAAPLLLVFGGLFVSADATFAAAASSIDVGSVIGHLALIGFGSALAAGYLRAAFLGAPSAAAAGEQQPAPRIPYLSSAVALGLLNILFVAFVAVQTRWLFGGMAQVREVTGLTLAQYARRGFFELVTAAALALPLLLMAEWATHRADARQERSFRALAGLQVFLVGALLVSALQRMILYVQSYGLTELRLYTTAFMLWLGGVFVWLGWTVLRGRRSRFAIGALLQAFAVLAGLHAINPDAVIARVDLARPPGRVPVDAAYVASRLSGDAVPVLLDALPGLEPAERTQVSQRLLARWGGRDRSDWRSWNPAASRARTLVRQQARRLAALAGTTPAAVRRGP